MKLMQLHFPCNHYIPLLLFYFEEQKMPLSSELADKLHYSIIHLCTIISIIFFLCLMLNLIDFFSPCINTYITLLPVAATETLETPGTGKSINTHALVKRWWIQNMWAVIIINTSLCMLPPHPCFNYVYKMQTHKKVLALLVLSSISDSNIPLSKHFHFYQSVLYEMSGY